MNQLTKRGTVMNILKDAGKDTVVFFYLVVIVLSLTAQAVVYEAKIDIIKQECIIKE